MTGYKTVYLFLATALLTACSNNTPPTQSDNTLSTGAWTMLVDIGDENLTIRWDISDLSAVLVNGEEHISVPDIKSTKDSIWIKMPRYDSEFIGRILTANRVEGTWYNYQKEDYSLSFIAEHVSSDPWVFEPTAPDTRKYDVRFSPDTEDEYPAIGIFSQDGRLATGTFLTETGDYRFLQGTIESGEMTLSCFDGAHMFLFKAKMKGDSMTDGTFYSGRHWQEPWVAVRNEMAQLTHPDSLTYLLPEYTSIEFAAKNMDGEEVIIDRNTFLEQVTIVQIFGTWCPNCYDENAFYKELYNDFHEQGLQIIPVAFERTDDFSNHVAAVSSQFKEMKMPYPSYIGGKASKRLASELFSEVNEIISFPTSFFIDRSGTVRKIHTGFYGPGTGRYYTEYTRNTREYIEDLLKEEMVASK